MSLVSSLSFSVSPKSLNFSGYKNKLICQNINFNISENSDILVYAKWTDKEETRDINDYNITNEEIKINFNYSKSTEHIYEICLKSKYIINKNGVLLFRVADKPIGIGIWINFHTENNNNLLSVLNSNNENKVSNKKFLLVIPILIIMIEILILVKKKIT
jgi:hypothetical protein